MGILIIVSLLFLIYFFRKVSLQKHEEIPVGNLSGPGTFAIPIVGESRYQKALEEICGGKTPDGSNKTSTATLILEDSNPYDKKAVRVDIENKTVGYLSRDLAREYREKLKQAGHPQLVGNCQAVIRGGWKRKNGDTGHFGVWLDLPTGSDL